LGLDLFDLNDRQLLAVADGLAKPLPALHLVGDLLLAADVLDHVGHHGGASHGGGTHADLAVVVNQQDAVKNDGLPGFNGQALDFQLIARAHAILFASCF